jgi:LPXTG-motif cell wall-anchored protein
MPRRSSRRVGSRALALIVVAIGAQLGAGEIASATADDTAPPPGQGDPSVTQQLAAEGTTTPDPAIDSAAATASAATAAPAPPTASSSVTISRAKASSTTSVSIVDFVFDPTALSVKLGDTVQWINNGTADEGHNVIGDGLSSPVLHTGESYSFTFTAAGTYDYICTIHPKMTGTVEVIDPNADEPKPKKKKKSGSKRGNSSAGASADGGGSSGTSGASGSATGQGSESAAGRSADAAGTSGSLPSTGSRSLSLGLAGLALLALGLALRTVEISRLGRRS